MLQSLHGQVVPAALTSARALSAYFPPNLIDTHTPALPSNRRHYLNACKPQVPKPFSCRACCCRHHAGPLAASPRCQASMSKPLRAPQVLLRVMMPDRFRLMHPSSLTKALHFAADAAAGHDAGPVPVAAPAGAAPPMVRSRLHRPLHGASDILIYKPFFQRFASTLSRTCGGRSQKAQRAEVQVMKYGQTSSRAFRSTIDFASKHARFSPRHDVYNNKLSMSAWHEM